MAIEDRKRSKAGSTESDSDDADLRKQEPPAKRIKQSDEDVTTNIESDEEEYVIESIKDINYDNRSKSSEVEVKWEGYEELSWEPLENLKNDLGWDTDGFVVNNSLSLRKELEWAIIVDKMMSKPKSMYHIKAFKDLTNKKQTAKVKQIARQHVETLHKEREMESKKVDTIQPVVDTVDKPKDDDASESFQTPCSNAEDTTKIHAIIDPEINKSSNTNLQSEINEPQKLVNNNLRKSSDGRSSVDSNDKNVTPTKAKRTIVVNSSSKSTEQEIATSSKATTRDRVEDVTESTSPYDCPFPTVVTNWDALTTAEKEAMKVDIAQHKYEFRGLCEPSEDDREEVTFKVVLLSGDEPLVFSEASNQENLQQGEVRECVIPNDAWITDFWNDPQSRFTGLLMKVYALIASKIDFPKNR